jgi:hypothetical protein
LAGFGDAIHGVAASGALLSEPGLADALQHLGGDALPPLRALIPRRRSRLRGKQRLIGVRKAQSGRCLVLARGGPANRLRSVTALIHRTGRR